MNNLSLIASFYRLFRMNKKSFEIEISNNPKYSELDRMHYTINTDPAKMAYVREAEKEFMEYKNRFENLVHDIIRIQNKIFITQQEFKIIDNPKKAGLDTKNVAKFIDYIKRIETNPDYDIFRYDFLLI